MKKLLFISYCFLFLIISCKKDKSSIKDLCEGVVCLNGGTCDSGKCVCVNGHAGTQCEVCATGWLGSDCRCALDSFVGTYEVSGTWDSFVGGTYQSDSFTKTITVSRNGNALVFNTYAHVYQSTPDSVSYCRFLWGGVSTDAYSDMSFRRIFDDSIFFPYTVVD